MTRASHPLPHRVLPRPSPAFVHWALDPNVVFLNHGSYGATPRAISERQVEFRELLEREPIHFFLNVLDPLLDHARFSLGALLNADAEGLALIMNATMGVSTVLRSLKLQPGDELLTNTFEYNACNVALRMVAKDAGANVVCADMPFPLTGTVEACEDQLVEAILARVTSKTRLVLLSHVTSGTALIFPVAKVVRILNERGIDTLVDGAHAAGMIPLDLKAINAPYYTGNLHKWLCTPKGCAFLYVREDRRENVHSLIISHHGTNYKRPGRSQFRLEFDFTGTADLSPMLCIPACIEFMQALDPKGEGRIENVMRRNHEFAVEARRMLCSAIHPLTPPPAPAEMLGSMSIALLPIPKGGITPGKRHHDTLHEALIEHHGIQALVCPVLPSPGKTYRIVRVAMQMYNSLEQIEYLCSALREELAKEAR